MPSHDRKTFYVTTAISYVNAQPHVGHAIELLAADVVARYHRLRGEDVYFLTGTDEHGTKVQRAADKESLTPQQVADKYSERFRDLVKAFGTSPDAFIRTTEERHIKVAQEFWKRADAAGDIYKKKYAASYCVGCEAFLTTSEVTAEGTCCIHGTAPEQVQEENYFFKLSRYTDWLKALLKERPDFVQPVGRYNEIKSLLEQGLEDVSISRPKSKLAWGIPVPGDDTHVMYVWFDALSNYVTGVGYLSDDALFKKFWPADVHIVGLDILRFHAALWPAMLKSVGLAVPRQVYVHGHITKDGKKMSKSIGNVVDPFAVVQKHGLAAVRYYLLAAIPFADGGDYSEAQLKVRYNAELANGIGNLVSRVLQMVHKFADGKVPDADIDGALAEQALGFFTTYDGALHDLRFHDALAALGRFVAEANRYVDASKPWELAKKDPERLKIVLRTLLHLVYDVGVHLVPFVPDAGEKILSAFGKKSTDATLAAHREAELSSGLAVKKIEALFPRKE